MNARILALVKDPQLIQTQDLDLLNAEVKKHPYLQALRALHLFGTHRLQPENYRKELSVAAAYTTDKKILYQLINTKKDTISTEEKVRNPEIDKTTEAKVESEKTPFNEEITFSPAPTAKPVFLDGVLNRILFEGEEDFLERETEPIDLESTLESGTIVTQSMGANKKVEVKPSISEEKTEFREVEEAETFSKESIISESEIGAEKGTIEDPSQKSFHEVEEFLPEVSVETPENKELKKIENAEDFSAETIVDENEINEEEPIVDSSKISFHGLSDFLPEVKITHGENKEENYEPPKPQLSRQEEEMQRLIAAVEAKVKASKKEKIQEPEKVENRELNFSDTQSFEPATPEIKVAKNSKENTEETEMTDASEVSKAEEKPEIVTENATDNAPAKNLSWKPMLFASNTPDALIKQEPEKKSEEKSSVDKAASKPEVISSPETEKDERPVFNASFFTQNVSAIQSKKEEKPAEEILETPIEEVETQDSNVTNFINTWQNWLKIERIQPVIEEKPPVSTVKVKNDVIEKFIEKEPRISKLKEESDFVVKERGSNISHLMTETLANLYVEQKLYAKAIKAYETLITKHPKKENMFRDKIQEIKELRKNP
ncbi:hypothetical protein L0B70_06215 [Kaistella sp. 97-N-M2]|uniref:tetratricopeptide repeat protein n=1 Tax=Kaistella sp. 97-N-M2 TaxID=2908645 RepID=UPI001F3BD2F5|nr:tetratricopeptide repeat protein [Kaistella sp. 97-N-M2]UJF30968.1 hypothetical protein L0B70_06215 [Kaistella sp. 97-N-M2]